MTEYKIEPNKFGRYSVYRVFGTEFVNALFLTEIIVNGMIGYGKKVGETSSAEAAEAVVRLFSQ